MSADIQEVSQEQLSALGEFLWALEDGPDAALLLLAERSDTDSLRRRAKLLLTLKRPEDVIDLLGSASADRQLGELLLRALIQTGRLELAEVIIQKAVLEDPDTRGLRAVVIAYYELAVPLEAQFGYLDAAVLTRLPSESQSFLASLLELTEIVFGPIKQRGEIATTAERLLCIGLLQLQLVTRSHERLGDCIAILARATPFPLELANLALSKLIEPDQLWIRAIRRDHPDNLDAQVLADILDGIEFGNASQSFKALALRAQSELSGDVRRNIFAGLHELSGLLGSAEREETRALAPVLLRDQPDLKALFDAEMALIEGAPTVAEKLLDEWQNKDDPMWVQLVAQLARSSGRYADAISILKAFLARHTHPTSLRLLATVALEAGEYREAKDALLQLVHANPDDAMFLHNLALAYLKLNDKAAALPFLERATALRPTDGPLLALYAQCLAELGQSSRAIDVLRAAVELNPESLEARMVLASILSTEARPAEAFHVLQVVADQFADEPAFLSAYMDVAYRSNHDREGHEAFSNLLRLQEAGALPNEVIRSASLEDLVRLGKEHRERLDRANRESLAGRMPWLSIAEMEHATSYWAWSVRTQPLRWHSEQPENVAAYSIYATNSFTVIHKNDASSQLDQISAPAADTAVTIDLSALLTVFQLELFAELERYFSRLYIPAAYLEVAQREQQRLLPHQLSQKTSLEAIRTLVDERKVLVHKDPPLLDMAHLAEYREDDAAFKLRDVHKSLADLGLLTRSQNEQLLSVASKATSTKELKLRIPIEVELATLQVLVKSNVLDVVANHWTLYISKPDFDELQQGLRAYEAQQEMYRDHQRMWRTIRSSPKVTLVPISNTGLAGDDSVKLMFAAGSLVAEATRTPLFADDRSIQQITLNRVRTSPSASFGTDAWLCALLEYEPNRREDFASRYLDLLERRYKFMLPTVEMLLAIVSLYSSVVPNKGLRSIAHYVHLCMRDPGLYSGPEPTTPPVSVSIRLYLSWIALLSQMLAKVWCSADLTEEFARKLTIWVANDCLPSAPQQSGTLASSNLAWEAVRAPLAHFCAAVFTQERISEERLSKGFGIVRQALNTDDDEYVRLIESVATTLLRTSDEEADIPPAARFAAIRILLRRSLSHQPNWPIYVDNLLSRAKVRELPRRQMPAGMIAVLGDDPSTTRRNLSPSALAVYRDGEGSSFVAEEIWPALFSSDPLTRNLAASEAIRLAESIGAGDEYLIETRDLIRDSDESKWRPVAAQLHDLLTSDFRVSCLTCFEAAKFGIDELAAQYASAAFGLSRATMSALRRAIQHSSRLLRDGDDSPRSLSVMRALGWSVPLTYTTQYRTSIIELLTAERIAAAGWPEIAEFASGLTDEPLGAGERFSILRDLAQHYLKLVECAQPDLPQETTADAALVLASYVEWVGSCLGSFDSIAPRIKNAFETYSIFWHYCRSSSSSSRLFGQVVRGLTPYSIVILDAVDKKLGEPAVGAITAHQRTLLGKFLRNVAIAMTAAPRSEENTFDQVVNVCRKWSRVHEDVELESVCDSMASFRQTALDPDQLLEAYKGLVEDHEQHHGMILALVDRAVRDGDLPLATVLEQWAQPEWRRDLLTKCNEHTFDQLMSSCVSWFEYQPNSTSVKWAHELVDSSLELKSETPEFERLVPYILAFAVRTNVVSAVDRLVASSTGSQRLESVQRSAAFLRDHIRAAPPWLAGRIRSVCVSVES